MSESPAPSWSIRFYTSADRAALERLYIDFEPKRAAQGLPPDTPARVIAWLDGLLAHGHHLVATAGAAIIGHVMLVPFAEHTVELAVFVAEVWRDHGVGTALNRAAVQCARDAGWWRVWLSVAPSNGAAIRSYVRAGFQLVPFATPADSWASELEMEIDLRAPRVADAGAAPGVGTAP